MELDFWCQLVEFRFQCKGHVRFLSVRRRLEENSTFYTASFLVLAS